MICKDYFIILIVCSFKNQNFEFSIVLFASTVANLNFFFPILPDAVSTYEAFVALVLSFSPQFLISVTSVPATDRIFKTIILAVLSSLSLTKLGSDTFDVLLKKSAGINEIEEAKEKFCGYP